MSATFQQGQSVYFLHPTESWVRGKVTEVSSGTNKQGKEEVTYTCAADQEATLLPTLKGPSGTVGKLPVSSVHQLVHHATTTTGGGDGDEEGGSNKMFDPTGDDTYDDLLNLPYLHDSTLLEQVRKRYYANLIYTRIGPIILALNPYDYSLKNYVDSNMPKYFAEGRQVVAAAGKSSNIPHAWTTAHYAYWLLSVEGENQSVIVSGESGAGKTETAKIVVKYLGNVSTAQCSETEREQATVVTHRVNATSPILEAFGNAKTVRNDNSSRFGKFMRVHFNPTSSSHPDAGHLMVGVSVVVYLLEKSRIVTHSVGERGYHSFYQLLSKDDKDEAKTSMLSSDLKLGKATEYDNLNAGKATVIAGVDDAADFNEVCRSMESIGLETEERSQVWAVIGAVLHLLAVKFSALNVDECEIEGASGVTNPGTDPTAASGRRRAVSMSPARDAPCPERAKANSAHLEVVKGLIGVEGMTPFVEELTTTATIMRNEKIVKRLKKAVAIDVRDAICKYLYESLFLWLVGKINDLVAPPPEAKDSWIALLDIFGFENFDHGNSFEQLCINLANETLQNHYNSIIFTRDMAECHSEGINTASVTFYDNQPCVDLICGVNFAMCGTQELQQSGKSIVTTPLSIMSLLDEECALGNGTDDAFVQKAITTFDKAPNFAFPKTERGAFIVKHYAGDVKYTVSGFRLKNKNTTKDSLREMLRASSKPFVGNLVNHADELQVIAAEEAAASGVAGKKGGATVSSFFKTQLVRLMSEINRTHPHWIRCVKPHSAKKPRMFHGVEVMTQMCSAGVLETVKIRQQGFSIRIPLAQFVNGAGRLLLQKLPMHTSTMLNRLATAMKAKTTTLQSDLTSLADRKLSANALAAKTNELKKQIDDITVEFDAMSSFSAAVSKGTHLCPSDDVKEKCRQVFENGSINHDSLAQVGVTKVFLRSDGFRILNSRTALVKTAIASSISAMARAHQSSSKVRCLQINEGFRRIQAALIARKSETAVRLLEKSVREKELVTKFRALLLLEAQEVKVRAATVVPEENAAFEELVCASQQSFTAAQEAFQARMAQVFAAERAEVEESEDAARLVAISTEVSERALLLELAVIFSDEEKLRSELESEEASNRHDELEVVGLQELRTSIADILERELAASLATVVRAEEAAREIAETTAIEKWYVALRAFITLHVQEDAARKYIESEEGDMYDDSILEGHEAGWEELQELWLEKKMLDDEEDRFILEDEETAFRQEVEHEWQQRLILFHLRAGESFERCKKIQAAMERAELLRQMEEERIREEEAARAHAQWVSEQREIAQAVWMAAVNVKRAKAKEDAEKKKRLTEWQDRALKERERIRKLQQKEISSASGLGSRNKLQSTFMKGDPVVIERAKEAEKNKRVEALRRARQAAASQSQSPKRNTMSGADPQLNSTVMTLDQTGMSGAGSPLARTMGSPNATMRSANGTTTTNLNNTTASSPSQPPPCPNLNFEAANLKFSKLMTQLDEIGRAALTPRTKRGILLKVVREEPEWTGDNTTSAIEEEEHQNNGYDNHHHHHEDPESDNGGHVTAADVVAAPEFVSIEEVDAAIAHDGSPSSNNNNNNVDNKQTSSPSPAPDRPAAKLPPPGYAPSASELAFDRGASPLGRFLVKQNGGTPMQSLHATVTTSYSLGNTYNNHTTMRSTEEDEDVDLFAAAATRRDRVANTLMATTTSRRSITSSRLVMNPFEEGWSPVANGSKAYLPDGSLIDL